MYKNVPTANNYKERIYYEISFSMFIKIVYEILV